MDRLTEEQIRILTGNFAGLEDYLNARVVREQPFNATNKVTLGSAADVALLNAPTHFSAGSVISKGAIAAIGLSNQGGVVAAALAGVVGAAAATSVADSSGNILNLVDLRESVTNNEVTYDDSGTERKVYGLIQCSSTVTDSDVIAASGSENIQISFVYYSSSDVLTPVQIPAGVYEFKRNTLVARRYIPVLVKENGANERDVVDLKAAVKMLEARYDVTTAFPTGDVWDLAAGTGGTGVSTPDSNSDYATIALPASAGEFRDNPRVVVTRNGVEQQKEVTVVYNSTTGFHFIPQIQVGERIVVRAPFLY